MCQGGAADAPVQSKELLAVGRVTFAESEITSKLLCMHVCPIPMHTWAALVGFSYYEGRKERKRKGRPWTMNLGRRWVEEMQVMN